LVCSLALVEIVELPGKAVRLAKWMGSNARRVGSYLRRTGIALLALTFAWLALRHLGRADGAANTERAAGAVFAMLTYAVVALGVASQRQQLTSTAS
jgi:hypothetical protein